MVNRVPSVMCSRLYTLACLVGCGLVGPGVLGCPDNCHCSDDNQRVVCEKLGLRAVPLDIPLNARQLYLGYNLLTKVKKDDFSKIMNLTYLGLNHNNIVDLENGAFNGLGKLTSLTLSKNSLQNIDGEVFQSLGSLEYLYLSQNHMVTVPDLGHLHSLKHVTLDNNQITNGTFPNGFTALADLTEIILANNYHLSSLGANAFKALANSPLAKLDLARCGLSDVDPMALKPLKKLISLILSYNPTLSPAAVKTLLNGLSDTGLNSLDLSGVLTNGNLPDDTFEALMNVPILQLFLSNSKVDVLRDNTFIYFPVILRLDLSHSHISNTDQHAFAGLNNLQILKLYLNDLLSVPLNLPQNITSLDLSFNPNLNDVPARVFINLRQLKELRLHHCALLSLASDALRGVELLEVLDISHNTLSGNSIGTQVMRDLNQLKYLFLNSNNMRTIENEATLFSGLHSLYYLDLRSNGLSTFPDTLFHPLAQLELMHLQDNHLGSYLKENMEGRAFTKLVKLRELHLDDNDITTLPRDVFTGLAALEFLGLQRNKIGVLEVGLLLPLQTLRRLDVSSNLLTTVDPKLLPEQPLALNLSLNPWDCWCGLIAFRNWMDQPHNVSLVNRSTYTCQSPQAMHGKPLLALQPASIYTTCHWSYILYGSLACFTVLVIGISLVLYLNRWRLRLFLYHTKHRLGPHHQPGQPGYERIAGQDFQYHAYVMVADDVDEDMRWVDNELLPAVHTGEGCDDTGHEFRGRHQLFYPAVHYDKGLRYMEMVDKIYLCRHVIVVLSRAALLNKKFRDFELGLALDIVTQRGWASIILTLRDIGALDIAPKAYCSQITAGRALQWTEDPRGQELFWQRMQEVLDDENEDEAGAIGV